MADDTGPANDAAPPSSPWPRRVFDTWPRLITAWLILIGIGINCANVISRYLFDFALFWAEEILIFLIVWCVFLGIVAVSYNGAHLKMDLISARIPSPWKEIINGFAAIASIGLGAFVAVQSWKALTLFATSGDVSVTASVPMVIPHAALLVGVVLMVLAVLFRFRAHLRNKF